MEFEYESAERRKFLPQLSHQYLGYEDCDTGFFCADGFVVVVDVGDELWGYDLYAG
jgi:hypothetical protein